MNLVRMKSSDVYHTYFEKMQFDFGSQELKKFQELKREISNDTCDAWNIVVGQKIIGYAFVVKDKKGLYGLLEYFAIDKSLRSSGFGTKAIGMIKERYSRNVKLLYVDSESPDSAQNRRIAARRLNFYRRAGVKDTGIVMDFASIPYGKANMHYNLMVICGNDSALLKSNVKRAIFTLRAADLGAQNVQKHISIR